MYLCVSVCLCISENLSSCLEYVLFVPLHVRYFPDNIWNKYANDCEILLLRVESYTGWCLCTFCVCLWDVPIRVRANDLKRSNLWCILACITELSLHVSFVLARITLSLTGAGLFLLTKSTDLIYSPTSWCCPFGDFSSLVLPLCVLKTKKARAWRHTHTHTLFYGRLNTVGEYCLCIVQVMLFGPNRDAKSSDEFTKLAAEFRGKFIFTSVPTDGDSELWT